jgi:hypothetical protein
MQMIQQALEPEALDKVRKALAGEPTNRHERRAAEALQKIADRERVLRVLAGEANE